MNFLFSAASMHTSEILNDHTESFLIVDSLLNCTFAQKTCQYIHYLLLIGNFFFNHEQSYFIWSDVLDKYGENRGIINEK